MKKTAAELRADAKKLTDQAKNLVDQATAIEQKKALRIGNEILKLAETDFKGFTVEILKELVKGE